MPVEVFLSAILKLNIDICLVFDSQLNQENIVGQSLPILPLIVNAGPSVSINPPGVCFPGPFSTSLAVQSRSTCKRKTKIS